MLKLDRPTAPTIGFLVLLVAAVGAWHFGAARVVAPDRDVALYAVVGHELRHGAALYVDVWDHKPPGIYVAYALVEVVTGSPLRAIHWLRVVASIALLTGVFALTRRLTGSSAAGLLAAVVWTAMSADPRLEATHVNAEALMSAATVWALYQWVRSRAVLAGWLAFAAVIVKPVAVPMFVGVAVAHWLFGRDERPAIARRAVLAAAIALLGLGIVAAWLATTGSFGRAWAALYEYNRDYAGRGAFDGFAAVSIAAPWGPAAWAVALVGVAWGRMSRPARAALVAWALGTAIGVAAPGHFFPHYDQLWVPVLAVSIGALATIGSRWATVLAAVAVVGLVAVRVTDWATATPDRWPVRDYAQFRQARAAGLELREKLMPGDRFFAWTNEPSIYLYARRRPPAPLLFAMHAFTGPERERLVDQTLERLDAAPPEHVVLETGVTGIVLRQGAATNAPAARLVDWVWRHYAPRSADASIGTGYAWMSRRAAPVPTPSGTR